MSNHPNLPTFVLDFLHMLTNCAKVCLGNIFQVIASKVKQFRRCASFKPQKRLVAILLLLILVPTSEWGVAVADVIEALALLV